MTSSADSVSSRTYTCPDCGNNVGFRSRPRSVAERFVLPLLLLRPVRCGNCFRRDYRPIFLRVRERLSEVPRDLPAEPVETAHRNVA
jgi:hypothetical protein